MLLMHTQPATPLAILSSGIFRPPCEPNPSDPKNIIHYWIICGGNSVGRSPILDKAKTMRHKRINEKDAYHFRMTRQEPSNQSMRTVTDTFYYYLPMVITIYLVTLLLLLDWFPGWSTQGYYNRQPNDDGLSNQDCVELRKNFSFPTTGPGFTEKFFWNDRNCQTNNMFICEQPKQKGRGSSWTGFSLFQGFYFPSFYFIWPKGISAV